MSQNQIVSMTIDTVGVSLMKTFITHAQQLPKTWPQLSKSQQDETIDAIRSAVQDAVKQAVELIAAKNRMHVIGTLDQITIKDGVRASIRIGKSSPGLTDIFERQGEAVALVVAHPGEELKGIFDVKGQEDQRALDLGHEYDPHSDGKGMDGAAQLETGSNDAPDSTGPIPDDLNELYNHAVQAVIEEGRPSVNFLQKQLGIGSEKAKTLLDFMQINGVVTAPDEKGYRQLIEHDGITTDDQVS